MIVEFSVSNFRSIRKRQTLSLVASKGDELGKTNVCPIQAPVTPDLLRSAVIYGANAAGKSNFILALSFMQDFVATSASGHQQGDLINYSPFLMATDCSSAPSEFEVIFLEGGIRYQYGFAVNAERIESEWLYAYPEGRPQLWFDRQGEKWSFGSNFRGQKELWRKATRQNALYLSTAMQLNAEQIAPVFDWFRRRLRVISPFARALEEYTVSQCDKDQSTKSNILEFLSVADLGVSGIDVSKQPFDPSIVPENIPKPVRQAMIETMENEDVSSVRLSHAIGDMKEVWLDMKEESGGTRKLFALAGPWLDVLANGWVLVVDELDTSLHPILMRHLVGLFHDCKINKKCAQLVFTTHDTSILDRQVFRRDQVWFVEKNRRLETHLYPLSDFSPRKTENMENGYLQGRYGALPFVGELSF